MMHNTNDQPLNPLKAQPKRADDFPYYVGNPVAFNGFQWLLIILSLALASYCLMMPWPWAQNGIGVFVSAFLFAGIPLFALVMLNGQPWRAPSRPLRWRDGAWMIGTAIVNLIVTILIGMLLSHLTSVSSNPAMEQIQNQSTQQLEVFFLRTIIQLFGEELISIMPFLGLMTLFSYWGLKRSQSLALAILGTAVWFAVLHLPTYEWRIFQCLLVIGSARIILLIPYLVTKNILVCAGAHIINDWLLFTIFLIGTKYAAVG
ncbi:CPBP family intramembrane metalloprotease [Motilimonas sp. 1_MG-2023]|uniref:CPBP family intramembrane glutamic endopeptidase n=1 Tax=Motilimonas sp. 1_MG-2023 TaxID=3062672 RepID=UPI0026E28EB6|nr:CPBP family intramembrane glutamic endopeptidase [Motilimonas sp. 1_MG-2023]MDO6526189.1 CPBP family intramembrane metalloprotease [Motilimonas sp. 1_MG-2023]